MPSIASTMDISNSTFTTQPLPGPSPPPGHFDLRIPALVSAGIAALIVIGLAGYIFFSKGLNSLKCVRSRHCEDAQKDGAKDAEPNDGHKEASKVDIEAQKAVTSKLAADKVDKIDIEAQQSADRAGEATTVASFGAVGCADTLIAPKLEASLGNNLEAVQEAIAIHESLAATIDDLSEFASDTEDNESELSCDSIEVNFREDPVTSAPFSSFFASSSDAEDEESIIGIPELALHQVTLGTPFAYAVANAFEPDVKTKSVASEKFVTVDTIEDSQPCSAVIEVLPVTAVSTNAFVAESEGSIAYASSSSGTCGGEVVEGVASSGPAQPSLLLSRRSHLSKGLRSTGPTRAGPLSTLVNPSVATSSRPSKVALAGSGATTCPRPSLPSSGARDTCPARRTPSVGRSAARSTLTAWRN